MRSALILVLAFLLFFPVYAGTSYADEISMQVPPPAEKPADTADVAAPVAAHEPSGSLNKIMESDVAVASADEGTPETGEGSQAVPAETYETRQNGDTTITEIKDRDGNLVEEVRQSPGGTTNTYFDSNGNPVQRVEKDAEGNVISTTYFTYDSEGRLLHQQTVGPNGEPISEIINSYDSEGRQTSHIENGPNGWHVDESWTYDNQGRETSHVSNGPGGTITETTVYNPDGSYTKTITSPAGTTVERYGPDGVLIPEPVPAMNPGGLPAPPVNQGN
jgi:hypothetical protein